MTLLRNPHNDVLVNKTMEVEYKEGARPILY